MADPTSLRQQFVQKEFALKALVEERQKATSGTEQAALLDEELRKGAQESARLGAAWIREHTRTVHETLSARLETRNKELEAALVEIVLHRMLSRSHPFDGCCPDGEDADELLFVEVIGRSPRTVVERARRALNRISLGQGLDQALAALAGG